MNWTKTLLACSLSTAAMITTPLLSSAIKMPTDISQQSKPATMKVLIGTQQESILLEVKGRHLIYDPLTDLEIGSGSFTKRAAVTPTPDGIKWKEIFPGTSQIRIVPGDSQSTILVNGIEYKGCIELYDVDGKLNIINEVDIERYLKSTLTFQFPQDLDEEVLDALAIIARTNAYFLVQNKPHPYYHISADEIGYQGHALTLQNIALDKAINRTRHVILTYQDQPFAATWTQNSAGKTADYVAIFRKNLLAPKGVKAPIAAHERMNHAWSFAIDKQDLSKIVGANTITQVDLYQDQESEKVYGLRIKNHDSTYDIDYFKLQKTLGANRLRSNDFTVKLNKNNVIFTGFGEGHGVGLCLLSAIAMAEQGASTQKILATFFPDCKLDNR